MTVYMIEITRDLRGMPAGTCLKALPHSKYQFKTMSDIKQLNGRIVHVANFRIIGQIEGRDDQIVAGIKNIYRKWSNEPPSDNHDAELTDLATRIYNYVKEELERNHNAARSG